MRNVVLDDSYVPTITRGIALLYKELASDLEVLKLISAGKRIDDILLNTLPANLIALNIKKDVDEQIGNIEAQLLIIRNIAIDLGV